MTKLVLIDGHAIMHRAYHALPTSLTTRENEPINAVYGFTSMLLKVIQDLKPTHIAVCFDRKEPTFRKEMFEDYQSHRPETEKELVSQFSKAKDVAKAMAIPVFEMAGFEADDLIGTIAEKAKVDEVNIVTGDRDILQLVNKKTKVYLPIGGLSNAVLMGEEEVVKKMKVRPSQIVDYKGFVGDPSDNYKGVPGVGPKTAEKLLDEYGTLEDVYKNLDKIPETVANKLKEHKESALTSQKLAKIVRDVDITFDVDKMASWQVNSPKLLSLFENYGFKTLTRRVKTLGDKIEEEKQGVLF